MQDSSNDAAQQIQDAFDQQQAKIDQLSQNLQNLHNRPVTYQVKPNINVNTRDVNKTDAFMLLVHSSVTLNTFTNTQTPIPSGFSNSPTCKVKFSDVATLKQAFTNVSGFKALRATTNFKACIIILSARCDEVLNSFTSWLVPTINKDFDAIPVVIGLPEDV